METTDETPTTTYETDTSPRRISLRVSTAATAVGITALAASTIAFVALYLSAHNELSRRDDRATDDKHAEQVAMDYALGASTIDYRDMKGWQTRLKANTSTQLSAKFDATAAQLDQIVMPLQWTSKATPIQAAVVSESGGIYKVNAFLDVDSTSAQTPQGGRTTVTYTVTLDSHNDWQITEVGGGLDALPAK